MNKLRSPSRVIAAAFLAAVAASQSRGYVLIGSHWYSSPITLQVQLGPSSGPLSDGSASWDAVAQDAMSVWNGYIGAAQFKAVPNSTAPIAEGNGSNNVFFSSDVYGSTWGTGVLAVTLTYTSGSTQTAECDVLFNRTLNWDSYRGSLRYNGSTPIYDFRRVAIHEFGHVLGLDHPDQHGQTVVAIMNSRISNLDTVATDDIDGAQSIYGPNTSTTFAAPVITTQPVSQTAQPGTSVSFSVAVTSATSVSYQWSKNGTNIPGATTAILKLASVTTADSANYTVLVSNSGGSVTSSTATLSVLAAPTIATTPAAQTVSDGDAVTLSVVAAGTPAPTYQWQKNGMNIPGATQATYTLPAAAPTDGGTYAVVVTNSLGSVTTVPVLLTVNFSQLVNLSARGSVLNGGALTAGFVLRGSGAKPILVRAIGPTLNSFGVTDALTDPALAVISQSSGQTLTSNAGWSQTPGLSTAFQSVGAFALPAGSADSAAEVQLSPGAYTTRVTPRAAGTTGITLAEVYDANPGSFSNRLINLSTLGYAGSGDSALVAGFSIQGNASKHLLIRAIGPGLATYGVSGRLANPRLDVYPSGQSATIAGNDDWGGGAALSSAFTAAGAFSLAADSLDAAVLLTLPPGGYTVIVSGVGGSTGNALVEIYDLDP